MNVKKYNASLWIIKEGEIGLIREKNTFRMDGNDTKFTLLLQKQIEFLSG